jgi:heptosyltransferase III
MHLHPRILVLRGGAIGDFIVTLPALTALRRQWPEAWIELIGYPHIAELARLGGLVDRVRSLDAARMARFFSLRAEFPAEQVEDLLSFHVVLSYLYDPHGVLRENMERIGVRQLIAGNPIVETRHAVVQMLEPLVTLAIFADGDECPELDLRRADVHRVRLGLPAPVSRVLALHPGSGSSRKNWPVDRFLELAERARSELGAAPLLIHGEADAELLPVLEASGFPLLPPGDLCGLARVLAACAAYVGNDSGVSHLAACVGTPTVALFGPTDPALWGPRGRSVQILRGRGGPDSLQRLSVRTVLSAIRAVWPA